MSGDVYNMLTGTTDSKPLSEKPGRLSIVVGESKAEDSQQSLRLLDVSRGAGLPHDIVKDNVDEVEAANSPTTFDANEFGRGAPATADWISQSPTHAAAVGEERGVFGYIEGVINSISEAHENERDMRERTKLLYRELNGEKLSVMEEARSAKLQGDMAFRAGKHGDNENNSEYFARVTTSGVIQMSLSTLESIKGGGKGGLALGVVAGVTTRNPAVTSKAMGFGFTGGSIMASTSYSYMQEASNDFGELRNVLDVNGDRIDIGIVRDVSKATGAASALIETAATGVILSMVPGVKGAVSRAMGIDVIKKAMMDQVKLALTRPTTATAVRVAAVKFIAAPTMEALEEFSQAFSSVAGREVAQSRSGQVFEPDDFNKDLEGALSQAKDAFVGSLLPIGAPVGGSHLYQGIKQANVATRNAEHFTKIGEMLAESKLTKQSPGTSSEIVSSISKGAPDVFIDSSQWKTYFQNKDLDPQEAARQVFGTTEEYDSAIQSDTPMRISMSDYASKIAPTEHNAFFSQEVRAVTPDAMNGREAVEMQKDADSLIKEDTTKRGELQAEISKRLEAIGYEKSTAATTAVQMAAFYETTSKKLGITDPMALFNRYGVDIQRATPADLNAVEQTNGAAPVVAEGVTYNQSEETKAATQGMSPLSKLNYLERVAGGRRRSDSEQLNESTKTGEEGGKFLAAAGEARDQTPPFIDSEPSPTRGGDGYDFMAAAAKARGQTYRQTPPIKRSNPFPDSVVQEEQYHVTKGDFKKFDNNPRKYSNAGLWGLDVWNRLGSHFGTAASAEGRFEMIAEDSVDRSQTIPVFLNIKNPAHVGSENFIFTMETPDSVPDFADFTGPDSVKKIFQEAFDRRISDGYELNAVGYIREELTKLGYDGIAYTNEVEAKGDTSYIVFNNDQISNAVTGELMQDAKGYITIGPDMKISIKTLETADLSTMLHESGHMYLEVLRDIASPTGWEAIKKMVGGKIKDENQRAEMLDDLNKIAKFLGSENLDNITVAQHEKFARAIELYLMEGVAPSIELRPAFARFKAWMISLYKTVDALNVRINPEIREVFDRMFASQEAIEAAEKEAEVVPVFATKEDAGMSETEFAAYNKFLTAVSEQARTELQQKVMRQMQREQKEEWKRNYEEMRTSIAEQISAQPEYALLDFLSQDGNKLSREEITSLYPEKYSDNLILQALRSADVYRSKEGLPAQSVAEQHGYSSVDQMIKTIINTRPLNTVIDEQTVIAMKERHGDILTDGTLADEAKNFVMGPGRSEVLVIELRALRKRQRESRPAVGAVVRGARATRTAGMESLQRGTPRLAEVRAIATDTMARMPIRAIIPQTYLVGARNSSKAAIKAVHKGDYDTAAFHKQKELLNIELYRAANAAKQDVEAITKFMRTFESSVVREKLGRAGDFYLEQIDAILERFNFSRMSTKEADKRKSLAVWIKDQEAKGVQINLSDNLVNEAYRKSWKDMTYDELVAVSDAAKHIKHLAVLKNKLLKSKVNRELNATIGLIDETMAINARHKDSRKHETRLPQEAAGAAVAGFLAAHRKISSLAREMDGFKDGGVVWESIIWPLNSAAAEEAMVHEKSNAELHRLFKPYITVTEQSKTLATSITGGLFSAGIYKKEFIPEINDSLSKAGRLMVALNWGNESNRQRIMDGYKWTPQQVEAIFSTLTKEDWDFVQGILDHFESFWPQVEALAKRVDGVAPKKVEAAVMSTPFGDYKGGYFPLVYDDRQSPKAFAHLAKDAAEAAMRGAAIRASTAHGERINRVANVKMPVRLDFGTIVESLSETIHDITHYETLIDLNRIIGNPRVQSSMVAHFGYEVYQQFRSAVRDVAGGDIPAQTQIDKSLNWLRHGTTISAMAWNVTTALMQPLGLTQSMKRIGVVPVAKGVGRWLGNAAKMESTTAWIYSKSDVMQERSVTQSREINEIRNQVSSGGLLKPVQDSYFYLIVKMQQVVDIPTWIGAYEKGMEQFNGDEAKAVATADQAVLDSQGGGQTKDMSAVQRGGPAQKLWTNFYSYFNTTFNLTAESYRENDLTNPYQAGRFMVDMLLLYTIPAILSMYLRDAMKGDIEEDEEKLLKKMAQQHLSYMLGPMLLTRELGGAIQGFYGYEGPAGAQFFSQAAKLTKQAGQGESDAALWKAANKTAGILFHYPAGQVQRAVEGLMYNSEHNSINPLPIMGGAPKER